MTILSIEKVYPFVAVEAEDTTDTAAEALRSGSVIAYPTETVYGLGCDYLSEAGYRAIQKLKSLEKPRPWILLIPNMEWLEKLSPEALLNPGLKRLVHAFWPGPLTLILPAAVDLPDHVIGAGRTVSLRISPDPFVRALMKKYGRPITSTSANPSGSPPATRVHEISKYFSSSGEKIALVVDDGVRSGLPSTLIRIVGEEWIVEREGAISTTQISNICRT